MARRRHRSHTTVSNRGPESASQAEATGISAPVTEAIPPPDTASVLDAIAALWQQARPTMLQRVTLIEEVTLALMEGTAGEDALRAAEREAHKMAGTVGSFGFLAGSRVAREIELLLGTPVELTFTDAYRVADLVVELRRELEGEPAARAAESALITTDDDPPDHTALLVGFDRELAAGVAAEGAASGLRLKVVATCDELRVDGERDRPEAVLIDLPASSNFDQVSRLAEQLPGVPILVVTEGVSFSERLELARGGARFVLPKPQSPRKLVTAVRRATLAATSSEATVLALDDDPLMLATLNTVLTEAGLRSTLVDSPQRFWEALGEGQPDLVILDLDIPGVSGLDLCRMIRNDARRDGLPILFLTVQSDQAIVRQIFAAGADDYVAKPISGPELMTRIFNRLERVKLRSSLGEIDPLTGLPSRYTAELAITQFFRIAARQSVPVSVVVVEVDHFARLSDHHGHATTDKVVRHLAHLMQRRLRDHDVAARWDDDRFMIGMYGASREIAVLRLTQILETFQAEAFVDGDGERFCATFSAGVAEFSTDGRTLDDLYRASTLALSQARSAGRARVIPSGWVGEPQLVDHTVDVALVEDDAVLASLLLHALETRGYRTEWYQDGEAAAHALAGSASRVQAQVVLLDVGLPGLDGFDVLRRLVDGGITRQTRVIMLTAHAAENEVLTALELGAFDHVAKPFSTPVLLQRIRRAMRR